MGVEVQSSGAAVLETHCCQTLQQMGGIDSTAHLDGRREFSMKLADAFANNKYYINICKY